MTKERYQNPTVGDNIFLRLFTYNSNNKVNVNVIWKGFNINMVIDTQTTLTETKVKKPVDDGHETIVSINSNLSLVDTLNYFESLVK